MALPGLAVGWRVGISLGSCGESRSIEPPVPKMDISGKTEINIPFYQV